MGWREMSVSDLSASVTADETNAATPAEVKTRGKPRAHPSTVPLRTSSEVNRHSDAWNVVRSSLASKRAAGLACGVSDVVIGRILRGELVAAAAVDDASHAHVLVATF